MSRRSVKYFGRAHDALGCVNCLRRRAWAKKVAAGSDDDEGAGWALLSLTDAEPVQPPTILEIGDINGGSGIFLIRLGDVCLIHGMSTAGKSPLCYLCVAQEVRRGNLGLIVDYEMGPTKAKALLLELGLTEEEIAQFVLYVWRPPLLTAAGRRRLVADVTERQQATGRRLTVAAMDSLTKSMSRTPGVSDNDAQDVTTWFNDLPHWVRDQFGCAVLVIDHSARGDGPDPSGSHKKQEEPDHRFWLHKRAGFSRKHPEAGKAELKVRKDRSGDTEEDCVIAVLRTAPNGSFYLAPGVDPPADVGGGGGEVEVPLDRMSPATATEIEVLEVLRAAGEVGLMTKDVTGEGAQHGHRRKAMERLRKREQVVATPAGRGGRGLRWWAKEFAPSDASS